ncbi:FixH family protein [Thermorudis peleae]|uniref:FixH family protein n=1 Tax=Thermorudis peleae TaxID=1382356 RepID=UPI00056F1232|nr:FixH family protein [Thermorudis peleae]
MKPVVRYRLPVLLLVSLFCSLVVLSTACQLRRGETSSQGVTAAVTVEPSPPTVGTARLSITLKTADGKPVVGAKNVQVEGTMTHAGMQPVLATAVEQGNGVYVVDQFRFTMAGDWVVIVRGTLPDGRAFETQAPVNGVKPAS